MFGISSFWKAILFDLGLARLTDTFEFNSKNCNNFNSDTSIISGYVDPMIWISCNFQIDDGVAS